MNIHEYQAKAILREHGITVPDGEVVDSIPAGLEASRRLGFPLVIKAQVHVGGRGKAGGVRLAASREQFEKDLAGVLGMEIKGLKVKKVLIEKALAIDRQFYLGITVDRAKQGHVVMVCGEGGIEIEETAKTSPEKIVTQFISGIQSLEQADRTRLVAGLGLERRIQDAFVDMMKEMFVLYAESDAQLVEINPLVLTKEGSLVACDAKMSIDDNALFRQQKLGLLREEDEDNDLEREAHRQGLAYVKLSGNIGIIGNGAGLVMATMDEVKRAGGTPANFLDIGGGAKKEVMQRALEALYRDKQVQGIFINIFGGITRCDEVAKGIIQALESSSSVIPLVLRLAGTQCEEGRKLLKEKDLVYTDSMEEGARSIVSRVKAKG